MPVTRFAPSPTGPLHLGHAYSALLTRDLADMPDGGSFLLRIEDIDQSRARPEWEAQLQDDLRWLGLTWPEPVLRQSARMAAYFTGLERLRDMGLLFACTCNRRDIAAAASAPQEGAPLHGPDGVIYPGTCREIGRLAPGMPLPDAALRLNSGLAFESLCNPLEFHETGVGDDGQTGRIEMGREAFLATIGDPVVARRDMGTSYHLAVVLDDAHQGITLVTRGRDLFPATMIHVLLQRLLELPTPDYHHHRLIRDDTGKRLAKRDDARAIALYRDRGATPGEIRRMVGL